MMGFYKFEGQHIQVAAGVQDLTSDKNQQEEQEQFDSIQEENKQTEGEGLVESMDCTVESSVRELEAAEPENLANIKSEMSSSMFPDLVASVSRHKEETLKIHEKMDVLLKQEKELEHTLSGIRKEIYEVEKDLKQRHCRLIESINYLSYGAPIKINTTVNLEKEYFEDDASSSSSISVGTKKKNFEKIRPKRKQTTTTQRISPTKKILNGSQNKSFVNGGVCRVSDVDGDILKFIDDGIIPVSLTEHTTVYIPFRDWALNSPPSFPYLICAFFEVKEELEKGIAYCMQKRNIAKKGFVCMVERICEWCTSSKFYHENEITQRKVREAMDIMLQVVKNEERKWKNGKDLHGWVLRDLEKWGSWEYPQKFNMGKTND